MTGDNWSTSHQPVPLVQKSRNGEGRSTMHFSPLFFTIAQAVIIYLCHTHNHDMFSLSAYTLTGFVLFSHSPKNYEMMPMYFYPMCHSALLWQIARLMRCACSLIQGQACGPSNGPRGVLHQSSWAKETETWGHRDHSHGLSYSASCSEWPSGLKSSPAMGFSTGTPSYGLLCLSQTWGMPFLTVPGCHPLCSM